jgi:hypothetical protein
VRGLFIVGICDEHLEVIGVFDDELLALLAASEDERAFVAPINVNMVRDISKPWPGLVFPFRDRISRPGMVAGAR